MAKKSSTKKFSPKMLIIMAIMGVGLVLGIGLVKKNQENRSKAATDSSWCSKVINCDLDKDGKITKTDSTMVLNLASGSKPITSEQKINCDLDNNGEISSIDALMILQVAEGKVCTEQAKITPTTCKTETKSCSGDGKTLKTCNSSGVTYTNCPSGCNPKIGCLKGGV